MTRTGTEYHRESAADLMASNSQRGLQALRVMEEISKVLAPTATLDLEQLRYRGYTLEQQLLRPTKDSPRSLLQEARLCILVDGRESASAFTTYVDELFAAGADMLQLRDKQLPDRELLARSVVLAQAARRKPKLCSLLF